MFRKIAFVTTAIAVLCALAYGADVLMDRRNVAVVESAAPLYALPPHEYPESNPVVATLPIGHAIRVLRVRYGKDFEALQVEAASGQIGWVISGEGVKVLTRAS